MSSTSYRISISIRVGYGKDGMLVHTHWLGPFVTDDSKVTKIVPWLPGFQGKELRRLAHDLWNLQNDELRNPGDLARLQRAGLFVERRKRLDELLKTYVQVQIEGSLLSVVSGFGASTNLATKSFTLTYPFEEELSAKVDSKMDSKDAWFFQ